MLEARRDYQIGPTPYNGDIGDFGMRIDDVRICILYMEIRKTVPI
jgi:hypothetical protein